MKYISLLLFYILMLTSCQTEKKLTIPEKIAAAHGIEHWKDVKHVKFTFRVDTDNIKGRERLWTWFPKTDSINMQTGDRSFNYSRSKMSSFDISADRAFINDNFWAFVPFQLVWDKNLSISEPIKSEAPVSKTEMNMITVVYPQEGGYTPGDAYDIFYEDNYIIREWQFRKGNSEKATLTNTFENYAVFGGLKIAQDHKKGEEDWNLRIANIAVVKE